MSRGSFTEFDWEEYNEMPESPVSFPLDVDAFAGNRTYANLLISRILEYGNLRDAHRDLLEKIENNHEPFAVSHLKVNGNDLKELGFEGKEIGDVLQFLLEKVWEDASLNFNSFLSNVKLWKLISERNV